MSIYDFKAKDIDGNEVSMKDFEGKVLIIANTASKCGFTPQYEDLQKLYNKYNLKGLEILGFPCNQFMEQEPGDNAEIKNFCSFNYGVTFPIFEKVDVNGKLAHPIFKYLKEHAPFEGFDMDNLTNRLLEQMLNEKFPTFNMGDAIRWNFTKFLVDKEGNVVKRFESSVSPVDMEEYIQQLL